MPGVLCSAKVLEKVVPQPESAVELVRGGAGTASRDAVELRDAAAGSR
jgi:hypothetical protein